MNLSTVILAAGLGTRMKSATPKVLHRIYGKPLVRYVMDALLPMRPRKAVVVIGPEGDAVREALQECAVDFALQPVPKGTGDAMKAAAQVIGHFDGTVIVVSGDTPLIRTSTIERFLDLHHGNGEDLSILSFTATGDHAYGRIVRNNGAVAAVVEDRDARGTIREIREVNSGIYAIGSRLLSLLADIPLNEDKGEYYLTDIVGIAAGRGHRIGAHMLGDELELTGINTRAELQRAGLALRDRIVAEWMDRGVSFIDASAVHIHPDVVIGADTCIYPNVFLEGKTVVGRGCIIYPGARVVGSRLGDNVTILDSTLIESSEVLDGTVIGPFAHLRPGCVIGPSAKIGNFVEVKKSSIGSNTKASHLSYIGDAEIGSNVNVGAGTITCNYDGAKKHRTVIEDGAFIGSDSQLVAPVRIGKGAYIGSGTTVTRDVPDDALAVSRVKQRNFEDWATRKRGAGPGKK